MNLGHLVEQQDGIVARRQLRALGIDSRVVARRLNSGRWVRASSQVVCTTTGRPTREQRRWGAVLHPPEPALLTGLAALEARGLRGWSRESIDVLVPARTTVRPAPWARHRRTRRSLHDLADHRSTNPVRLHAELTALAPLRRAADIREWLTDLAGGSQSANERDVLILCRRHGLVTPRRQISRADAHGVRRWTDCEWELADGRTLVLEVDGHLHREARTWQVDIKRTRGLTTQDRVIVRCTPFEVRHETGELADDLRRLGVPIIES
ncbi:hypothetical protein KLP28_04985 [Nocardioidaceae bacterium]|nr:hypothetical protein KLP28_04985 [Nocardioidaceae bacterium]